ncbi:acyl carrier protein [candidate division NPL-UPA2 bacterium Unc8]|uniref:Acyl carrier protein n=1 Tax=candidate division NPL-UPA2 bacterium Unc8 TaxID=1980939 RepID=A0A399FX47_UNCN2|nr:Acyl carrier protein [Bacillota bacterium]MBT9147114.1 Acyl carrier protein [Bacillota bacterium]RII00056.1 MAG: acyl carrier protein [candidate division NPL-UPA2 bacterium Unc8]
MGVEEKIKEIVIEQLGVNPEQVTLEASFTDDLGADSLGAMELIMALEEEFGLEISQDDAEKIITVGDAIQYVIKRKEEEGGGEEEGGEEEV